MAVKVSVIIATYNSGERLRDTIASLSRQSLGAEEYEVVLVDDGSTDGTPALSARLAEDLPQLRCLAIEHSGWPGRPRNVGVASARGEYVLFMDHDDDLFPEALERMHDFASRHGSDVLLAKEVVKGGGTPGWSTWRADVGKVERIDQAVLECMTPHKLYRRQFLLDADVRFPEGAVRLEDYNLNAQAYVRARTVSIMSDYPCYRWIIHETNAHKKPFDHDVYWRSFRDSLAPVLTELVPGDQQDEMLVRWYSSRVLRRVGPKLVGFGQPYRTALFAHLEDVLPLFPERLDARLSAADRLRSQLLREGDVDSLLTLSALDSTVRLRALTGTSTWSDGALLVTASAVLHDGVQGPLALRRDGDRLLRVLPDELAGDPAEDDVRAELEGARVELSLRAVDSAVEWPLATSTGSVTVVDTAGELSLRLDASARIDPLTAAFGGPLDDDVWQVWLRVEVLGLEAKARVPANFKQALPALLDGRHVVAFNRQGKVAVDVGAAARTVVGSAHPRRKDVHLDAGQHLTLDLPRVHVKGRTTIACDVLLGEATYPGRLVGDASGARVVTDDAVTGPGRPLPAGALETRVLGRRSKTDLVLRQPAPSSRLAGWRSRLRRAVRRS